MSKFRKKLKKAAMLGLGLYGASKFMGAKANVVGDTLAKAKKSMTSDAAYSPKKFAASIGPQKVNKVAPGIKVNYKGEVIKKGVNTGVGNVKSKFVNLSPDKGPVGIYQGGKKVSGLNQKAINVLSDGKIQAKGKTFENKKAYSDAMKKMRAEKRSASMKKVSSGPSLFGFRFDKPLFKKGSMIKARGGGMARTKPTKMY